MDRTALFNQSKFGRNKIAQFDEASKKLAAENQKYDAELEKEEAELTELRKTMAAEEFQILANDFDVKVKRIRAQQNQKSRVLSEGFNQARNQFSEAFNRLLQRLIEEQGIEVLLSKESVIAFNSNRDITDLAIKIMDEVLSE